MSGTPFKMKGSPMKRNFGIGASPVKHGDGTWGGQTHEEIQEEDFQKYATDAEKQERIDSKQLQQDKAKLASINLKRVDYPELTDKEFDKLISENKAKLGMRHISPSSLWRQGL